MATAERALLHRLGWEGARLLCSADSPHGEKGGYESVNWGLIAAERPAAWWRRLDPHRTAQQPYCLRELRSRRRAAHAAILVDRCQPRAVAGRHSL